MYIDDGYCSVHDKQCEMDDSCDKYEPNLSKAWDNLIVALGESLGLYKVLDWLNNKLSRFE